MRSAIFQQLIAYCEPYVVPENWHGVSLAVECYRSPRHPTATVARLLERFTENHLVEAGVATCMPEGMLLSPPLADPAGVLLVLRNGDEALPYAVITANGILGANTQSVGGFSEVLETRQLIEKTNNTVFVTFSIEDQLALWSVGCVATPAAGLLASNRVQLRELCDGYGWNLSRADDCLLPDATESANDKSAPSEGDTPATVADAVSSDASSVSRPLDHKSEPEESIPSFRLIIVGWSLASVTCDTPAGLLPLVNFLSRVERSLELDLSNVGVWQPDTPFLEKLRFDLEFGSHDLVRQRLMDSVNDSARSLDGYERHATFGHARRDYASAASEVHRLLQESVHDGAHSDRLRTALANLNEMIQRDLVAPLIERAMAIPDPVERNQMVALSGVSSMIHQQAPLVQRMLAINSNHIDVQSREALHTYLASMGQLCSLLRGIRR